MDVETFKEYSEKYFIKDNLKYYSLTSHFPLIEKKQDGSLFQIQGGSFDEKDMGVEKKMEIITSGGGIGNNSRKSLSTSTLASSCEEYSLITSKLVIFIRLKIPICFIKSYLSRKEIGVHLKLRVLNNEWLIIED